MDGYTRATVKKLLELYPEYLEEILLKQGLKIDVNKYSAEDISAMIAYQRHAEEALHESSIYTCKCGSKNVVTREVQTRSADEGSTILHICMKCGAKY